MKNSKLFLIFALFMVLLCCFSAVSASEDVSDDTVAVSDDFAVDEVIGEVDSNDESLSIPDEEILASDDSNNESLEINDVEEVDDVDNSSTALAAEENDVEEVDDVDNSSTALAAEENDDGLSGQSLNDEIIQNKAQNDILGISYEDEIIAVVEITINPSNRNELTQAYQQIARAKDNGIIYIQKGVLAGGPSSNNAYNITLMGESREETIVNLTHYKTGALLNYTNQNKYAANKNATITWINVTFVCPGIILSDTNYKFINCTFVNVAIDFGKMREDNLKSNNMSSSPVDVYNYAFENCDFVNYTQTAIVGHMFSNVAIINCAFNNVTADAIVSTNANRTDDSGRQAGVTIKDSTFKDVTVKGIVKAQNYSVEAVTTDNKYDFATQKTLASDDVVYVDVPVNETTLTVKVADIKEGENFTIDVTLSNNLTTNVSVVINQKEYNVSVINGTGSLKVADKLAANTYNVEASYAGEYPYAASTNTTTFKVEKIIINTALTAPKVSATYNVAKNLVITLKDANGNVLVGKYINVKVGTISKNIQTDKKGQVSVNVATLVPKSYTASISFAGDDDYNKASTTAKVVVSKATPKLTTKKLKTKVKVKTKKVTATLKDNKGKVLKNTKVTLKVKGKTYTAKTNKKGKATFKVTKLNKKGTFKGTVKFAGNKYFKAVSKTVKIVVKK